MKFNELECLLTLKPFVLTAGILPGGKLNGGDSLGEAAFSGEMGADLPDSDGLFRSNRKRGKCGDLGDQSGPNHFLNPMVDAFVQQGAIPE